MDYEVMRRLIREKIKITDMRMTGRGQISFNVDCDELIDHLREYQKELIEAQKKYDPRDR